jgi:hypothetical protein
MARKPTHTAWTAGMGLRPKYHAALEEKIKQYARGSVSPLGGQAKSKAAQVAKLTATKGRPK